MANDIRAVLKELSKKFEDEDICLLSETDDYVAERISSGSLNLDIALGGGVPRGRTCEFFGNQGSGKTTIAMLHAREMQKAVPEGYILFVDLEGTFDKDLAEAYGIDPTRLVVTQPTTGEKAFDIAEAFIRSGTVSLVIIDSVAAVLPEAEDKANMEQQSIGLQARLISKAMRKLTPICTHNNCTLILINQIREKVGVLYGSPEITSGGRAIPFYASIRLNVRAGEKIPDPNIKGEDMGHVVNIRVVKNKTARPNKTASFNLIYGVGIDKTSEIADIAVNVGLFTKGGAWLKINGEDDKPIPRKWTKHTPEGDIPMETIMNFQGKERLVQHLYEDTDLCDLLTRAIYGETITLEQYIGG